MKWIFHTIPQGRAGRPRHVEVGEGGELRRRQRLGRRDHRRAARLGVRRDRLGDRRLLRRLPQGRQPVREHRAGARRDDRRAQMALPDRPPRHLGLRQSAGADPGHHRVRGGREGRRRAAHEDGLHVRARSRHRQAAVPGAGDARAALGGAGRGDVADAARSAQAAAARAAEPDGGRSHQHHARGARAGAEGVPPVSLRADLHAAEPAGHDHDAGASRRRRVARRELRSRAQHALRQRQRSADDQQAAARARRARRRRGPGRSSAGRSTTAPARLATAQHARGRRRTRPRSSTSNGRRRRSRPSSRRAATPCRRSGSSAPRELERARGVPEDAAR